ncbi:MAG: hypothetical protein UZ00_C0010G0006 [Parcubacteria group bacterium GW2011_GWA1_60_11]|nr:MAG: hypothetical protein UY91_C0004G0008 [Parcubacteria group bacterium GW2011_GWB1_55_9]KKW47292.1 MAG: hypothetical protein UZ00_C0010G0006 [Parcubacteria group bacterium GW2011_GWA1_60_11]
MQNMTAERRPIYQSTEDERRFEHTYLNPEEAHKRAQETLSEYEIKPETFTGLYGADILKHDAEEVARLEALFEQSPSKIYADILEAIACEHGELSNWFGPNSQVIKTARYDDYKNKIDMVVETESENQQFSHLALGIDITFGSKDLHKKFDAIKAGINKGSLGQLKYFHSDRQHFTGRLRKLPQVVVGIEIERVKELGLLWMNRRNKELREHPVQIAILEEAALQLETFVEYSRSINKNDLVVIFERELQKINELLDEKIKAGIKTIKDDKVFEEIKRNLLLFTNE